MVSALGGASWRPPRRDAAIALAVAGLNQVEYHFDYAQVAPITTVKVALSLLVSLPLAWRRVAPLPSFVVVLATICFAPLIVGTANTFGTAISFALSTFSMGLYARSRRESVVGVSLGISLALLGAWLDKDPQGLEEITSSLTVLVVWGAGVLLQRQTERARRSEAAVVRERLRAEAHSREMLAEERGRIARELHDVVAHGIGVMVIQARGGRRVLDADPNRARHAFDEIERVSMVCLQEMRVLLGLLRVDGPSAPPAPPQPGLDRLDELLDEFRAVGLDVEAEVEGERAALAPGLDLSAYRIVQEALTNVLRHARGARARLRLTYDLGELAVQVSDDGPATAEATPGHGLIGMRERAKLFGGELTWSPGSGGGFVVRARLPYLVTTS